MATLSKTFQFSTEQGPINRFADGVNVNFDNIVSYINDRNDGTNSWDAAVIGASGSGSVNLTINGSATTGVAAATLTNSPTAGDPTTWVQVNINGTNRYIPCW